MRESKYIYMYQLLYIQISCNMENIYVYIFIYKHNTYSLKYQLLYSVDVEYGTRILNRKLEK